MKLYVLGTGNGVATKCYNTCFAIQNNGKYFLVDGGGWQPNPYAASKSKH